MSPRKSTSSRTVPVGAAAAPVLSTADLARHLNLSQWSVSRAINGRGGISEETRQRVLATMDDLGFRPNLFARGLRGRGTGMIGVCFSRLKVPILDHKIFELQEFLRKQHLQCMLETTHGSLQTERRVIEDFRRIHADGVVLFHSVTPPEETSEIFRSLAVVSVDPAWPQDMPVVMLNRYRAMRLIIDHLLDLGHTRFGLLGIAPDNTWRWPPLVDGIRERGLDPEKAFYWTRYPELDQSPMEVGMQQAIEALRDPHPPTALICQDDPMAVGAVQGLRDLGLSVPRDVSVTGFNNQDIARALRPTLTTVEQHASQLTACAGQILMEQMDLPADERGAASRHVIEPTVIFGESTGPARRS